MRGIPRVPSQVIGENLVLPDRCLAVFVDDTGHEALAPGHPVYGLGGCAVLGRDLVRLIWEPWKAIRKRVTGCPDTPLHAGDFPSIASLQAVANFFVFNRLLALERYLNQHKAR